MNTRIERQEIIGLTEKLQKIETELKNIRTVDLDCTNPFFLEKFFWVILGILGVAWAFYFIPGNIQIWKENPSIKMQGEMDLSQLKYPAISLFQSGTTKYAIAEILGNYLNHQILSQEFRELWNLLLKCALIYRNGYASKAPNPASLKDYYYWDDYHINCLHKNSNKEQRNKFACKVNDIIFSNTSNFNHANYWHLLQTVYQLLKGRQQNNLTTSGLKTAKDIFEKYWEDLEAIEDVTSFDLKQFNEDFVKSLNTPEIDLNTNIEELGNEFDGSWEMIS